MAVAIRVAVIVGRLTVLIVYHVCTTTLVHLGMGCATIHVRFRGRVLPPPAKNVTTRLGMPSVIRVGTLVFSTFHVSPIGDGLCSFVPVSTTAEVSGAVTSLVSASATSGSTGSS